MALAEQYLASREYDRALDLLDEAYFALSDDDDRLDDLEQLRELIIAARESYNFV